jgi:hypothetical protein
MASSPPQGFFANLAAQLSTPAGWQIKDDGNGNLGIYDSSGTEIYNIGYLIGPNFYYISIGATLGGAGLVASLTGAEATLNASALVTLAIGNNDKLRVSTSALEILTLVTLFNNIATKGYGLAPIYGLDNRTGLTTADASATTLYTTTGSGQVYEISARILATAGLSATYVIKWTEGGVAQSVSLKVTATDTEVHDTFTIQPDSGTAITAQLTSVTSSTVNVACSVKEIA